MADYFNKKLKNGMGSYADFKSDTDEEESMADILYPTMANLRRVLCREEKVQCTFSSRGNNGVSELDKVRAK